MNAAELGAVGVAGIVVVYLASRKTATGVGVQFASAAPASVAAVTGAQAADFAALNTAITARAAIGAQTVVALAQVDQQKNADNLAALAAGRATTANEEVSLGAQATTLAIAASTAQSDNYKAQTGAWADTQAAYYKFLDDTAVAKIAGSTSVTDTGLQTKAATTIGVAQASSATAIASAAAKAQTQIAQTQAAASQAIASTQAGAQESVASSENNPLNALLGGLGGGLSKLFSGGASSGLGGLSNLFGGGGSGSGAAATGLIDASNYGTTAGGLAAG